MDLNSNTLSYQDLLEVNKKFVGLLPEDWKGTPFDILSLEHIDQNLRLTTAIVFLSGAMLRLFSLDSAKLILDASENVNPQVFEALRVAERFLFNQASVEDLKKAISSTGITPPGEEVPYEDYDVFARTFFMPNPRVSAYYNALSVIDTAKTNLRLGYIGKGVSEQDLKRIEEQAEFQWYANRIESLKQILKQFKEVPLPDPASI